MRLIYLTLAGISICTSGCSKATPGVPDIIHAQMNGQHLTIPSRLLIGPPRISEANINQQPPSESEPQQEPEIAGFGLAMDPKTRELISFSESVDLSNSALREKNSSINHILIDVNYYERKDIPLESLETIAFDTYMRDIFHKKESDLSQENGYISYHVVNFNPVKDHYSDMYLSSKKNLFVICDKLAIYPNGPPSEASCQAMFPLPHLNASVTFSVNQRQFTELQSLKSDIERNIESLIDTDVKGN